jgi:hypothetical protein
MGETGSDKCPGISKVLRYFDRPTPTAFLPYRANVDIHEELRSFTFILITHFVLTSVFLFPPKNMLTVKFMVSKLNNHKRK